MTRTTTRHAATLLLACAALAATLHRPALAQDDTTPAELRRENDLLRQRIDQLEAELAALQQQLDSLRQQNLTLQRELAARPTIPADPTGATTTPTPTPPPPPASPLEQDPFDSLEALLAHLQQGYATTLAERTFAGRERKPYLRDVRAWIRDTRRDFRHEVDWLIELDPASLEDDTQGGLRFWVIDPDTRLRRALLPATHRFPDAAIRGFMADRAQLHYRLNGVLAAQPQFNANRDIKGSLDYPPFIGPFAEFSYALEIRSLAPTDPRTR